MPDSEISGPQTKTQGLPLVMSQGQALETEVNWKRGSEEGRHTHPAITCSQLLLGWILQAAYTVFLLLVLLFYFVLSIYYYQRHSHTHLEFQALELPPGDPTWRSCNHIHHTFKYLKLLKDNNANISYYSYSKNSEGKSEATVTWMFLWKT